LDAHPLRAADDRACGSPLSPARARRARAGEERGDLYRDRSAALDPADAGAARNGIFSATIVLDGRIAGTWTRRIEADAVTIALKPLAKLSGANARLVARAAARYGRFLGRPARVV